MNALVGKAVMDDPKVLLALLAVGMLLTFGIAVVTVLDVGAAAAWAGDRQTVIKAIVVLVFIAVVAGLWNALRSG